MDRYITLPESDNKHIVGNKNCTEGWCDGGEDGEYPCLCRCGGLIHAEFGDEDHDMSYWLFRKCDKCDDEWEFADDRVE